jgi:hypothetical protein
MGWLLWVIGTLSTRGGGVTCVWLAAVWWIADGGGDERIVLLASSSRRCLIVLLPPASFGGLSLFLFQVVDTYSVHRDVQMFMWSTVTSHYQLFRYQVLRFPSGFRASKLHPICVWSRIVGDRWSYRSDAHGDFDEEVDV